MDKMINFFTYREKRETNCSAEWIRCCRPSKRNANYNRKAKAQSA